VPALQPIVGVLVPFLPPSLLLPLRGFAAAPAVAAATAAAVIAAGTAAAAAAAVAALASVAALALGDPLQT